MCFLHFSAACAVAECLGLHFAIPRRDDSFDDLKFLGMQNRDAGNCNFYTLLRGALFGTLFAASGYDRLFVSSSSGRQYPVD